ncbi:MAG: DUF58 domain-containing protein [Planctomycetota bacterium]
MTTPRPITPTATTQRRAHKDQSKAGRIVRRYEFGWSTVVFVLTTVFLSIGAINSQNNLLFWAFGVSVGGLIVSGVLSGAALMSLRLERIAPRMVRAGEPARILYRVRNTSRWMPAFGLVIRERGSIVGKGGVPGALEGLQTGAGYIGAGRSASVACPFVPARRGALRLEWVQITSSAPFGLLRKTLLFEADGELLVGPRRLPMRAEAATPSGHSAGPKRPDRRRIGHGEEFFGLREYRHGDSPRTIAWRPSARHDQLVVRQMTPPAPPRIAVRLAPIGAGVPALLAERTLALAAAAVEAGCSEGMAVGLEAIWANVRLPFRSGEPGVEAALTALARIDLDSTTESSIRGLVAEGPASRGERHASVLVVPTRSAVGADTDGVVLIADEPGAWLTAGADVGELDDQSPGDGSAGGRVATPVRAALSRLVDLLPGTVRDPKGATT